MPGRTRQQLRMLNMRKGRARKQAERALEQAERAAAYQAAVDAHEAGLQDTTLARVPMRARSLSVSVSPSHSLCRSCYPFTSLSLSFSLSLSLSLSLYFYAISFRQGRLLDQSPPRRAARVRNAVIAAKFDEMIVDGTPLKGRYEFITQFDNSGNHGATAPDALIAKKLNLRNGWPEQRKSDAEDSDRSPIPFRDGWWKDSDGVRHAQSFVFEEADGQGGFVKRHKGLEKILQERGLWRAACQAGTAKQKKMSLAEAIAVLSEQPDFVECAGKTWLQESCAALSVKLGVEITCVYGVKFHPELSAIEYFWGECKRYTRRHCDYSLATLRVTVPEALKLVGALTGDAAEKQKRLGTLRRHFAHVERYLDAYELGTLTPAQVEWAMHHYTSHRRVDVADFDDERLNAQWLSAATLGQMPENIKKEKVVPEDEDEAFEIEDE